jgi:hypothetical protein
MTVLIKHGSYRNEQITDTVFGLVKSTKEGKNGLFITVNGTPMGRDGAIRVKIARHEDVVLAAGEVIKAPVVKEETDTEIMDRMREKFSVLDEMTYAACRGTVRGMVVTGPPGVGKSFGVEAVLNEARMLSKMGGNSQANIGIEKGSATAIGLFCLLYKYAAKGSVLVLDDSDTILYDEASLNMLKAALDGNKKRRLSWRSESRALENRGIPETYTFSGSIIFITNLNFEKTRGKIAEHLGAIMSRCHYLDMAIGTTREKLLRCKQVVADGMLESYGFKGNEEQEILDFVTDNQTRLRELSLRMVTKIADLRQMSDDRWQLYANNTCVK